MPKKKNSDMVSFFIAIVILAAVTVITANGTQTNVSGAVSSWGMSGWPAFLYRNGAIVSNPDILKLPVGTYTYKVNTTSSQNYTSNETGVSYTLQIVP